MPQPLHVLVLAQSADAAKPFVAALRPANYAPVCTLVQNEAELRAALGAQQWHVVLYCGLPQPDLSQAVALVRESNHGAPVIAVSHAGGEAAAIAALQAGAQNFVSASQVERFVPAVEQALRESRRQHTAEQEHMRYVLAHAQCLLWSGVVTNTFHASGLMHWETEVFDEAAAQRFAPIECLPGERYTAAWYRHRLPEDQVRTDALSGLALRNNHEQYTETFRCRLRDGTVRWFSEQVRVTPLSPDSWRVVGVAMDITERKQAEARLAFVAEASALLAQSLDVDTILGNLARLCVPFLADMCVVDMLEEDGSLRRVASHHVDPAKAELARELMLRFPPDPAGMHPAARAIRTGEPDLVTHVDDTVIATSVKSDEHRAIVERLAFKSYMVVPLRAHGQVLGAISLVATEAARPYNHADLALAQEIAQRAAMAVENGALYSRAQQAIQIRETFLSIAAHELRTPLTALLGNAQVLERRGMREGLFATRDQQNLATIISQANRLNRLIELLLDVSRLQQDRLQLELFPVDLSAIVSRVAGELQPILRQHTLAIDCEPGVLVPGDELRLEQVLHNLLSNAIKYMPGGGLITLRLVCDAGFACLSITDGGIGIPQRELPNLFTQFYRASNVDPKRISGLGVGLYLVREVVTRHGGSVAVESAEGRGSTFSFTLPLLARPGV